MARVPIPAGNVVALRPMTDAKFRAADNGGGVLGAIGDGLQKLGGAVSQHAEVQDHINAQVDEASAKQVLTEYSGFRNQQLYTGDNAFSQTMGQAALNARMPVQKSLEDKIGELSSRLTSPRAKLMFTQAVNQERERDFLTIGNHAVQQAKVYNDQQDSALQASSAQDFIGATLRGDAEGAKTAMGTIENSIRAQYGRNGLLGEPEKQALSKIRSAAHSSVVDAKTRADPVAAAAYLHDHEGEMLPTDIAKLSDSLYAPLLERQASAVVDGYPGDTAGYAPPTPTATPGTGSTAARMIAITLQSESGNKDYANGKLVTSSAGAQAAMQTMPGTQRDPGYGVRPAQNGSVAEKNRVGRDYLSALTKRYGGDAAKAWAAYNAGPGRLDAAVKQHGAGWLKGMPAETRGYVSKNMAMLGGADTPTYSPRRDDLAGIYAYIEAQDLPYDVKKQALAEADHRVARNDRLLNRQQDDAKDAAYKTLDSLGDNFTSVNQIPPEVRRNLSPEALHSLNAQAAQNAKPKAIASNGDAITNLHQAANLTPDEFKRTDLRQFRPFMTAGEYDQIATLQSSMLAKPNSPAQVSHSAIWSTISRFSADVGLDLGTKAGKPNKPQDRQDAMRLFSIMQGTLQTITDGKRAPTDDEIKKAFDNAVMPIAHKKSGWFGDSTEMVPRFREADKPTNSVAVPKGEHDRIAAGLRARGLPYDDQSVARFYIQAKR